MILLFVHGWGFDASFWDAVIERLPGSETVVWERGYFGDAHEPLPDAPYIAIGHSFGAMRVLADPPPGCAGVVAINGFDRFAARDGKPGLDPRLINRMLGHLDRDPRRVIIEFRARLGNWDTFAVPNVASLKADLARLRDDDESGQTAQWQMPILSLQGGADPLLSAPMRDAAFSGAPDLETAVFPDGGHLLPLTDPAYCARMIEAFTESVS